MDFRPRTGLRAWGAQTPGLLPRLRQAMATGPGRRALLLPPLGPRPRRAARLLLQAAARSSDGALLEAASGELLLLGAQEAAMQRLAADLRALGLPPGRAWLLDEAAAAAPLLRWAARTEPAPRPAAGMAERLVAAMEGLALGPVTIQRGIIGLGPDSAPQRLALHLAVSRRRLARALGATLGGDADLLEEAALLAEARLSAAPPAAPGLPLLLRPGPAAPPPPLAAIALLPLALATDPAALAARRDALLAAGWAGIGLDDLDATALALLDPHGLAGEGPVLLRWSPRLAARGASQALRGRLDPARLILTGCDGTEALDWGLDAGIRRFAGPRLDGLPQVAAPPRQVGGPEPAA